MPTVIGLTGGFGTGKTFVASIFKSLGAKIFDADMIAREAVHRNHPAYKKIVRLFGDDILNKRLQIDRRRLSSIVFDDRSMLERLNRIVHPVVIRTIRDRIASAGGDDIVVIDAPLLIEAGLERLCDAVVVVISSRRAQIERCAKKFAMDSVEVTKRIRCQIPIRDKIKKADFVINNNGTRPETRRQVRMIWKEIVWR